MRILFHSILYPNRAEPLRALYNRSLVGALRRQGHELRVVAPVPWFPGDRWLRRGPTIPPADVVEDVPVLHPRYFRPRGLWIHRHAALYRRWVRPVFAAAVEDFQPDCAIVAFAYPDAVAMGPVCRDLDQDYAVLVLGSDVRIRLAQPRFRPLVLEALAAAPIVLCPGGALRGELIDAGLGEDQVVAFANGVDHEIFHPAVGRNGGKDGNDLNDDDATREVLFVGNLVEIKGVDRLLRAWSLLPATIRSTARLRIVGSGPLRARLQRQADALGIADRVVFAGPLPPEAVAAQLRRSACLCLTSRSEGMPNVVLEALASGVPVVATDVGELRHMVEDGVNGFLVRTEGAESAIAEGLAQAQGRALSRDWDAQAIAARVAHLTWDGAARTVAAAIAPVACDS